MPLTNRQREELYARWRAEKREETNDWLRVIVIALYLLWMIFA